MSRFPVSTPRGNRLPPYNDPTNIMLTSDVHMTSAQDGPDQFGSFKARDDMNTMIGHPSVKAWVIGGDITNRANEEEYAKFHGWMTGFNLNGKRLCIVPGNHDIIGSGVMGGRADIVTPEQWAERMAPYGVPSRDYVVDIGQNLRILCVSPMTNLMTGTVFTYRLTLDAITLGWCDDRISETSRQCIIVFHAPLYGTVGTTVTAYNSYDPAWHAHSQDAYTIEQMLAKHSNIIAWVSGHTHSGVNVPDNVKSVNYGAGPMAAVSMGSPLVLPAGTTPEIISALMTVYPNKVEIRYRDHGAGQWLSPVRTVNL